MNSTTTPVRSSDRSLAVARVVIYAIVLGVMGWAELGGIYHAASKHGTADAMVAVSIPPVSWYRSVEFFWHKDGVPLETKRLVAICVQEPARVLQNYYGRPHMAASELAKAPTNLIVREAIQNRKDDLGRLSELHRTAVEVKMRQFAEWLDSNTTIKLTHGDEQFGPFGLKSSVVELPDSENMDDMAKSLCIELFDAW